MEIRDARRPSAARSAAIDASAGSWSHDSVVEVRCALSRRDASSRVPVGLVILAVVSAEDPAPDDDHGELRIGYVIDEAWWARLGS